MSSNRRIIIVTGTGRCGTSAVARMLAYAGLPTGPDFGSDHTNPHGFFEDKNIVAFHDDILRGGCPSEEYHWYVTGRLTGGDIVIKDPRFCEPEVWDVAMYELPLADRRIIYVERDEDETLESLQRAYDMPLEKAKALYRRRTKQGRELASQYGGIRIEHRDIISNPEYTATRLVRFLDLSKSLVPAMASAVDTLLYRCRNGNS